MQSPRLAVVALLLAVPCGCLRVNKTVLPDPHCHNGVLSAPDGGKQACCAGYCGECSDYPTCNSVRGQDSTFACCKSKVLERECGQGAPANVCLKSCTDAVPPCIMPDGKWVAPDPKMRQAGTDCNEAVSAWRKSADTALDAPMPKVPTLVQLPSGTKVDISKC